MPDAAIQYVLKKSRVTFKERYSELEKHTKIIPTTIIDGIDHFIAFRLEESNIYDVQNLATFNPTMLHIESPYGIYQTVDWVAQAQLCTVVGAERFLALKAMNVRTIFDLERAVLSEDADATLVSATGAILTMDCNRDVEARNAFGMKETIWTTVQQTDPTKPHSYRPALTPNAVKHIAALIVDDLHVRRLRQIWKIIREKLGPESESLEDSHYPQRQKPQAAAPENIAA